MRESLAVRFSKKLAPQHSPKLPSLPLPVLNRDSSEKYSRVMDYLFSSTFESNIKTSMRQFLGDFLDTFRQATGVTIHMRAQDESVDVLSPLMHDVKDGRLELSVGELPAAEDSSRTLKLVGSLDSFKDVYMEQYSSLTQASLLRASQDRHAREEHHRSHRGYVGREKTPFQLHALLGKDHAHFPPEYAHDYHYGLQREDPIPTERNHHS